MLDYLKNKMPAALKLAIALTPFVASMYLLYWLGKNEIWVPETMHRDKITIVVMVAGMGLSFLLQSHFAKRNKK